jgi:hypothetical protein
MSSSTANNDPLIREWLREFRDAQQDELKPWIMVESGRPGRFASHHVSVKGARRRNDDTSYADGQLFGVYDGHGPQDCGKRASQLASSEIARAFWAAITEGNGEAAASNRLDSPAHRPAPVNALNKVCSSSLMRLRLRALLSLISSRDASPYTHRLTLQPRP